MDQIVLRYRSFVVVLALHCFISHCRPTEFLRIQLRCCGSFLAHCNPCRAPRFTIGSISLLPALAGL